MNSSRQYARAPLAVAIASALLLAACGGGSSNNNGGAQPTAVSGKAADGYLVGATVCLDLNHNRKCDDNEPNDITTAGGAYTLEVPAGIRAGDVAVVVEVIAGVTEDEDNPGVPLDTSYVLTAPPGKPGFVSPLTTAVHAILESNPALTAEQAADLVRQEIGAGEDVSLFADYIAAKQDDPEYERLHKVAQVSGRVLAANQKAIEDAAAAQGLTDASFAALLALAVQQVLDQLQQSAEAVDEAGDDFDIETIAVDVADTTDLEAQLEDAEAVAGFTKLSAQTLLAKGGYWIWGRAAEGDDPAEYEYGWVKAKTNQPGKLDEAWFIHDAATGWQQQQFDDDKNLFLGSGGWKMASDTAPFFNVSYNADGSARLALPEVDVALKLNVSVRDVSGQPMKTYLTHEGHEPFAAVMRGEPTFSEGAEVYKMAFMIDQDQYNIEYWGGGCETHPNCNLVWGYASDTVGPVTSFAELIYPSAETGGYWIDVGDGLKLRIIGDKRVQIEDQDADNAISYVSWDYKTVHGEQLMVLDHLPKQFHSRLWEDGQLFFAVQDGYVRRGSYLAKGSVENPGELWFNQKAFNDIKTAFDEGLGTSVPGAAGEPIPQEWHGTWYDAESQRLLSFLPSGLYMWAEKDGLEYGTLTRNVDSGELEVTHVILSATDGVGFWNQQMSITSAGPDRLELRETATPNAPVTFERVQRGNGIVGSWWLGMDADTLLVFTFLEDGTYFAATGESDDEGGEPGLEHGKYQWDSTSGALNVTEILFDSNGSLGLDFLRNEPDALTATVAGDTLTVFDGEDTYSFPALP